jgi:hypothetical protein
MLRSEYYEHREWVIELGKMEDAGELKKGGFSG